MDIDAYRASDQEQARIADLLTLVPSTGHDALDIGARDGYISRRLAERFESVVALDLKRPNINIERVRPIEGDATNLDFPDRSFDLIFCAEVLEHIAPTSLPQACDELCRVAHGSVVIGVPYRQDLRVGRTTCAACHRTNPPWGHVNSFDEARLRALFKPLLWVRSSYVGTTRARTNPISSMLLEFAGNPYGTYDQDEACIYCGQSVGAPFERTFAQKIATRAAFVINRTEQAFLRPRANWLHVLFSATTS